MKMTSQLFKSVLYLFGAVLVFLLPSPTLAATKVSADQQQQVQYTICGDQEAALQGPAWTLATNGAASPNGPVQGYTGSAGYDTGSIQKGIGGGNGSQNSGNCPGSFYWSWNQPSEEAIWTWQNAALYMPQCSVSVFIPSWYAGALDAQYILTLATDDHQQGTFAFDKLNQKPISADWALLTYNNGNQFITFPDPNAHIYTLSLTLRGGNTSGLYLAASAVRFFCKNSTSNGSGLGQSLG